MEMDPVHILDTYCGGQRTEVREGHRGGREEEEKDDDDDDVDAHECPSLSRLVLFIVKNRIFYFFFIICFFKIRCYACVLHGKSCFFLVSSYVCVCVCVWVGGWVKCAYFSSFSFQLISYKTRPCCLCCFLQISNINKSIRSSSRSSSRRCRRRRRC